jgi:hypothetical protein
MYKLIKNKDGVTHTIFRIVDKTSIPLNLANTDYQEYLKWLEEGNTPLPADEISE